MTSDIDRATELAAQCWCDPKLAKYVMDPVMCEVIVVAIRKAIDEAVEIERKRCQKWFDIGQNEMDRAWIGIAEGRNWRDG